MIELMKMLSRYFFCHNFFSTNELYFCNFFENNINNCINNLLWNNYQVLRDRGQGFGILVSKSPKETNATYSLQEPLEVQIKYF